jgi:hypothetical protein
MLMMMDDFRLIFGERFSVSRKVHDRPLML